MPEHHAGFASMIVPAGAEQPDVEHVGARLAGAELVDRLGGEAASIGVMQVGSSVEVGLPGGAVGEQVGAGRHDAAIEHEAAVLLDQIEADRAHLHPGVAGQAGRSGSGSEVGGVVIPGGGQIVDLRQPGRARGRQVEADARCQQLRRVPCRCSPRTGEPLGDAWQPETVVVAARQSTGVSILPIGPVPKGVAWHAAGGRLAIWGAPWTPARVTFRIVAPSKTEMLRVTITIRMFS